MAPGIKRWTRLLTKADKDPSWILDDKRCLKPQFVDRFFDLCDAKALEVPWVAPDYAEVAMELARRTGDPHHAVRAGGIAVHTCIGNELWQHAADLLEIYRENALACCPACASDWLRRQGDLLAETRDAERSREYLERAAAVLGDGLDDHTRGHILFVRGIAYHFLEDTDQALDDMGEALLLLELSTPEAYFSAAVALVACFLEHVDERRYDERAHAHLDRFRERLKGLRHRNEVRDRLRWALGQIEARLGNHSAARGLLERARVNHVKHSPHRFALAIGIDEALVFCRNMPETYVHSIRRILLWCAENLKLEKELGEGLAGVIEKLDEEPYNADGFLEDLRHSYVVPVPCLTGRLPSAMDLRNQEEDEREEKLADAAEERVGGSAPPEVG